MSHTLSERALVTIVGAVQFANILDFMMVMPLGPDFAQALQIPMSHLGYIGGAYTFAAALSAIICSFFLDRFDRRHVLALAMFGLSLGTLGGALAQDFGSLLLARLVAGIFGGPATSIAISTIIDRVAPARRGRALGAVMGAFSLASVLGVPTGLELSAWGGWRLPFYAVGSLCFAIALFAWWILPSMTGHVARARNARVLQAFVDLMRRPEALGAYAMVGLTMMATFMLIPNIPAYIQVNLGYPREHMGLLYLVGGAISFFVLRLCGALTDRIGSLRVAIVGTLVFAAVVTVFFIDYPPGFPILALFAGLMIANSIRAVPMTTVATHVPHEHERASFMSLRSAVQHLASSAGAALSSLMLTTSPHGELVGVPEVGLVALCLGSALPFLIHFVNGRLPAVCHEPA